MCVADAYTASAGCFDSKRAIQFAEYYLTFRHFIGHKNTINDRALFKPGDHRFLFFGLRPIIERLLLRAVTHAEVDEAKAFFADRKARGDGSYVDFEFMEPLWRRVVEEFGGFPPIEINAIPEGSTFYPGEPIVRVRNTVAGFGPLAAYFEASLIKVWNASQRGTMNRHWLNRVRELVSRTEKDISPAMLDYWSRAFCHGFEARATGSDEENAHCSGYDLAVFHGTDTFHGAYYQWLDGAPNSVGSSVWAGAHHSAQGFENEADFYETMYNNAGPSDIVSMIGDCYDWYNAVDKYILPLAVRSQKEGNGKIVVGRPDSGETVEDEIEQMLDYCRKAISLGLYTEKVGADGKMYKFGTFARLIQGNSMDYFKMTYICEAFIAEGLAPHGWFVFGFGGYRVRCINRDAASVKYALYAVGEDQSPVIKLSMVAGKRTRPFCKVIRTPEALRSGKTVVTWGEAGDDIMIPFFDGEKDQPFRAGFHEKYDAIANRANEGFDAMPPHAGDMSDALSNLSDQIAESHLPSLKAQ